MRDVNETVVTGCGTGRVSDPNYVGSSHVYTYTAPPYSNCTVKALFLQTTGLTYTITASAGTGGTISPSGAFSVGPNPILPSIITIMPNPGYMLASIGGTCPYGTLNSRSSALTGNFYLSFYSNNLDSNCSVTVTFSQMVAGATYYSVSSNTSSVSGNNSFPGIISPQYAAVQSGQTVRFTMTPSSGHSLAFLSVSPNCNGGSNSPVYVSGNTYTIMSITADCMVNAYFK
jgi:plastocyanin